MIKDKEKPVFGQKVPEATELSTRSSWVNLTAKQWGFLWGGVGILAVLRAAEAVSGRIEFGQAVEPVAFGYYGLGLLGTIALVRRNHRAKAGDTQPEQLSLQAVMEKQESADYIKKQVSQLGKRPVNLGLAEVDFTGFLDAETAGSKKVRGRLALVGVHNLGEEMVLTFNLKKGIIGIPERFSVSESGLASVINLKR